MRQEGACAREGLTQVAAEDPSLLKLVVVVGVGDDGRSDGSVGEDDTLWVAGRARGV